MIINKTMDRNDLFTPESKSVIGEVETLMRLLRRRNLKYTTWWGAFTPSPDDTAIKGDSYRPYPGAFDDRFVPWFKYWEIAWVARHSGVLDRPGRCLDMGGCSSVFSYWLASRGYEVLALDLKRELVENGDAVAEAMGWKLRNTRMDIADVDGLEERFDYVFSLCVVEHLPVSQRVDCMGKVGDRLSPGGVFALTFDYLNPHPRVKISSERAVFDQIVRPSGLELMGHPSFVDNGRRYLVFKGKPYTFAALFLRKK